MSSLTPVTLLCAAAVVLFSFRSIYIIRQIRWIPITLFLGLMIVLRCGLVIPFQDLFPALVDFSLIAKERAAVCMLLFTAVAAIGQEIVYHMELRNRASKVVEAPFDPGFLLAPGIALWALAMLCHFYFLILKQNIEFLPTALGSFVNPDDHYGYRSYFTQMVYDARRGQWISYMSLFIFSPLALTLLAIAYQLQRNPLVALLGGTLVVVTPVAGIIHGQRSILVIFAVIALLSFLLAQRGQKLQQLLLSRKVYFTAGILMITAMLMGAAIYTVTAKIGFVEALGMMLSRVFLVPTVTPNFIYELFPEQFDFRGLNGCLHMQDRFAQTTDVTYGDLAMALQGVSSNVNSTAIAVGYSGLGYFGAILISVLMVGMAVVLDLLIRQEPPIVRIAALVISFDPVQMLTSDGLYNAIFSRGYIVSALVIVACFRLSRWMAPKGQPIHSIRPQTAVR